MKYKVTENIQFIGCNNNDSIEKEYIMNESRFQFFEQKLESDDFESANENRIYTKMDGFYTFRDDLVRCKVDEVISEITRDFHFDQNTKEWEDVRNAMVKAMTESSAENFKVGAPSVFYDFEGAITQIGIEDYPEITEHSIWDYGYSYEDKEYWNVCVTRKQKQEVMALKPETLYEHLKSQIGVQTSDREHNYFAPKLYVGPFALSLQINYYLWKYREAKNISHKLPMTEDEFNEVCKSVDTYIDVMIYNVRYGGKLEDFGRAGQISCYDLCEYLKAIVTNEETKSRI